MYAVNDTPKTFLLHGIRFSPYIAVSLTYGFTKRPEFVRLKKDGTVKVFANWVQAARFANDARCASISDLPRVKARVNGTLDEYLDRVNRLDAPDWKKVGHWYIALGCKCLLGDVADTVELRVAKVMRGKETVTTDASQSVAETIPAEVSPVDSSEATTAVLEAAATEPEKVIEETPAAVEEEKTNPVHDAILEQIAAEPEEPEVEAAPVEEVKAEEPDVEESGATGHEQTVETTEEASAESEPQTDDEQPAKKSKKKNRKA